MKQVIHFKSTEERLAFLKGELKEIIPKKVDEKKEAPKKEKKTTKAKKTTKKESK